MELRQVKEGCYYFHSPVNVGYINQGKTGLLIDAGLDKSAANKVLRELEKRKLPVTHLFITHAHADHFGGGATLQAKKQVYTLAPEFEEAILRYPKLEPLYLYHGVNPPKSMRNKFLEGQALHIDEVVSEGNFEWGSLKVTLIPLPGHSENQLGLIVNGLLFAGDGYMSIDTLKKHGLPFLTDLGQVLNSLERLLKIEAEGAIPGHGVYEADFKETVKANLTFYYELLDQLEAFLDKTLPNGGSVEEAVAKVCEYWHIPLTQLGTWALNRTAITAYLTELSQRNGTTLFIKNGQLWFKLNKKLPSKKGKAAGSPQFKLFEPEG